MQVTLRGEGGGDSRQVKHVLLLLTTEADLQATGESTDPTLKINALKLRNLQIRDEDLSAWLEKTQAGKDGLPLAVDQAAVQMFDRALCNEERPPPAAATFANPPPDFWSTHGEHLGWGALGCMILLLLGVGYAVIVRRTMAKSLSVLEALPGRVGVINLNEKILYMNGDCSSVAAHAQTLKDVPNINYQAVSDAMHRVFDTGKPLTMEYEFNAVKRSISIAPLAANVFGQKAVIWCSHDNPELQDSRKYAENLAAQLKKQIRLWELLLNALPAHIFAKDPDKEYRYVFCNRAMQNFFGMDGEEILNLRDSDIFSESDCQRVKQVDECVMASVDDLPGSVTSVKDKSGNTHLFHAIKRQFTDDDGSRLLIGIALDVTELAKTKEELRDTLEQHNLLLDNMPGFVFTLDIDNEFRYTSCNKAVLNMLGLTAQEVIGKNDLEIFDRKTGERLMANSRMLKFADDFSVQTIPFVAPATGEQRIVRVSMKRLNLSGNRHWLFGFGVDTTEQETLKAELQDAVAIFRLIMDHIPCHIVAKDINNDFAYTLCNRYFCQLTGRDEERIIGYRDADFFSNPEELKMFRNWDMEAVRNNRSMERVMSFSGGDGTRLGHAHWIPLKLSGDRHWLFLFVDDITDLEHARNEAAQNAEWFKLTLNSIGDGVLTTDIDGRIVLLNPIAEKMLGCELADVSGKPHEEYFHIVSAEDELPMSSPIARSLQTGATVGLANHTVLISQNGKRYHIADNAAPIRDRQGGVIGGILVFRDVTEEYENRDMLRTALACLEETSELTRSASFQFEPATREITGTKLLPELLPLRDGKLAPGEEWINPDDLPGVLKTLGGLYDGKCVSADLHFRTACHKDLRYYRVQVRLTRKNNRQFLLGAIQDVTEITRNAGDLKSTQELWDQVINSIPIMFFAKDADNGYRYTVCNRSFAAYLGKTPAEIIGLDESALGVPHEEILADSKVDEQCIRQNMEVQYEKNALGADGQMRHMQIVKRPFIGADGRQMILGVANDITELNNLIASERANSEILSKIVSQSDFNRVLDDIADTLKTRINCNRVVVAKCNGDGLLRLFREWVTDGIPSITKKGVENYYQVWDDNIDLLRQNKILKIVSLPSHPLAVALALDENYNTASLIIAPIFVDGVLWGALWASYVKRRDFSDVDERLMSSCANVIALAEIRDRQTQDIARSNFEKQMILNNIRIPVWLYDGDGTLLRGNTAAEKLARIPGGSPDAIQDWSVFQAETSWPFEDVIAFGDGVQRELRYGPNEYIVKADPVKDEQGKIVFIVQSAVDVTDMNTLIRTQKVTNFCLETLLRESDPMKAIQKALRAASEFMSAPRSVIIRIDRANRNVSSFAEYAQDGKPNAFDHVTQYPYTSKPNWEERFQDREYRIYPDLQRDSEGLGADWMRVVHDDGIRSLYANRLLFDNGLWGYIGFVFQDQVRVFDEYEIKFLRAFAHFIEFMLERKSAQEQIMDALQKAQAADKAKSFFIASVSHEIRTPLNSVIGFSELLRDKQVSVEEQREYIDAIAYSGNALLQLINDVLDLSKLEADQMELIPKPCDFATLAKEVMNVFRHRAAEKNLRLAVQISDIPILKLDEVRIRQILFNLIGNAVKFTDHGTISLAAEFIPDDAGSGTLRFHVSDTGVGIAENDIKRLQEPFVQLSQMRGTNAANNGTGLGLSICKRLVEKMSGHMSIQSQLGTGSSFCIELHHIERGGDALAETPGATPVPGTGESLSRLSILLVDDVKLNLKVIRAMCRKSGMEDITEASSGAEALALLREKHFDLILTDMWMPGMSGAEFAGKVRREPEYATVPIFAVTADMESGDNFEMEVFSGVILKPVTLEKMQTIIDAVRAASGSGAQAFAEHGI